MRVSFPIKVIADSFPLKSNESVIANKGDSKPSDWSGCIFPLLSAENCCVVLFFGPGWARGTAAGLGLGQGRAGTEKKQKQKVQKL